MSDFTTVYFTWIKRGFNIPSTLVEFSLFGNEISIKFYGVIIAFGFILAALFGGRMAYKWRISLDKMLDVLIYGTLAGIIGARAYYVIFQWDYYKLHPAEIPQIWQGGLAIYGGIIGGLIAAFIVCKVRKINILNLLDMGGISLLIGQGIGRWGNFMNQEAFGTNTDAPWGMWSKKIAATIIQDSQLLAEKGIAMDPNKPVHPTFLYESLWCLIGFLILYDINKKFRYISGQRFLGYKSTRLLPRGFSSSDISSNNYLAGSVDYQFPLCYPEGGISGVIYFKRIRLNVGADYARFQEFGSRGKTWRDIYSYGGDLLLDLNILRMSAAATATVKLSLYKPSEGSCWFGFGLELPF